MNKKFVIVAAVLMYAISAYFSYEFFAPRVSQWTGGETAEVPTTINPAEVDEEGNFTGPKTEECPINGEMLTKNHRVNWAKRRPLGVMIENHTEARPQSGLSSSDVVYEFVAEGGITRFLAIFYCKDAKFVGPVRSARIYFVQMMQGYGANPLYAHVGGANTPGPADALGEIADLGWGNYNDLNQFSIPFPTFYRDYSRLPDVATEHTMYSSTDKLWKFAAEKRKLTNVDEDDVAWDAEFEPWTFVDEKPGTGAPKITYDFWDNYTTHSVSWAYDKPTNSYVRSHVKGGPHLDKNTDEPLSSKNVIVMFVKESPANDGYPGGHMLYGTTGKGNALVFQNGAAPIKATWRKPTTEDQVRFYDAAGDEIPMVRGHVWVSGVPIGVEVDY